MTLLSYRPRIGSLWKFNFSIREHALTTRLPNRQCAVPDFICGGTFYTKMLGRKCLMKNRRRYTKARTAHETAGLQTVVAVVCFPLYEYSPAISQMAVFSICKQEALSVSNLPGPPSRWISEVPSHWTPITPAESEWHLYFGFIQADERAVC